MHTFKIKSHAKINLALNITGKSKKLHKIESIVSFINLYDLIFIKKIKSSQHRISFYGKFSKNISKINTVSKLLDVLDNNKLLNDNKFFIKIEKNIPQKAGLGGGSMNSANILNFLEKKKFVNINQKQKIKILNLVGSDVVLGIESKNSVIDSKGNIKRFSNCPKFYTLLVKPEFGCSTKTIYSKVKKFNKLKYNKPKKFMFSKKYLSNQENDLEKIAFSNYPKLKNLKNFLLENDDLSFVRMTGSGSVIIAYFQSKQACEKAKVKFRRKYKNYWCNTAKTI
jgi:4-diphosphocytidyl-2-C-methyl-D-erythritol kinase